MAIDLGEEQEITLTVQERTTCVEIRTTYGEVPVVHAQREKVWVRLDGSVAAREPMPPTSRTLTQVATQEIGGVAGQQLAEMIALWMDTWRQEDIAAEQSEGQ